MREVLLIICSTRLVGSSQNEVMPSGEIGPEEEQARTRRERAKSPVSSLQAEGRGLGEGSRRVRSQLEDHPTVGQGVLRARKKRRFWRRLLRLFGDQIKLLIIARRRCSLGGPRI